MMSTSPTNARRATLARSLSPVECAYDIDHDSHCGACVRLAEEMAGVKFDHHKCGESGILHLARA